MARVLLLALIFSPGVAFGSIVITEVMCKPSDGADYEWIKIKNIDSQTISIQGWKFDDQQSSKHGISNTKEGTIGDFSLKEGEEAILVSHSEIGTLSSFTGDIYDTVMSLTDSGKTLSFFDGDTKISSAQYGSSPGKGILCPILNSQTEEDTNDTTTTTTVTTPTVNTITREVTKYNTVTIQPPEDIFVRYIEDKQALVGSKMYIQSEIYNAIGDIEDAQCYIAFGDGSESLACEASHLYEFAGTYIVSVTVRQGSLSDNTKFRVLVSEPALSIIVGDGGKYTELINRSSVDVGLNGWSIRVGYKSFKIPKNTIVPTEGSIKVSASIMHIDIARYGGIAQLFNALGKVVADSSVPQPQSSEDETEIAPVLTTSNDLIIASVAVSSETLDTQEPIPIVSSIVGTPLPSMRVPAPAQEFAEESAVNISESVVNVPQVASAASSNVVPDRYGKWLVGLFALLGIAALPIWLGKADDDVIDGSLESPGGGSVNFTIEEVK